MRSITGMAYMRHVRKTNSIAFLILLLIALPQVPGGQCLFRSGGSVTVTESCCLPVERSFLAGESINQTLLIQRKRDQRLARFLKRPPGSDRHTLAIMRLYWDDDRSSCFTTLLTRDLSGPGWAKRYPTSKSLADLDSPFRESARRFVSVIRQAGAYVKINATYRPPERAYLMHCAYRIAREDLDPLDVPHMIGVGISWVHFDRHGDYDPAASKHAAEAMVEAYKIAYPAALFSPHIERRALDMTVSWSGVLNIRDAKGKMVRIYSGPKSGDNRELQAVGRSYGVHKFLPDPPHWQDTPL